MCSYTHLVYRARKKQIKLELQMSEHSTRMIGSDNFSNISDQLPHILIPSWQLAALQKQIGYFKVGMEQKFIRQKSFIFFLYIQDIIKLCWNLALGAERMFCIGDTVIGSRHQAVVTSLIVHIWVHVELVYTRLI